MTPDEIVTAVLAEADIDLDSQPNLTDHNHVDAYSIRCLIMNAVLMARRGGVNE